MMYGMTMYVDGSLELYNITDTMVEGIVKDISHYKDKNVVGRTDKYISIKNEDSESTYFYSRDERKERLLSVIDVY